MTREWEELVTQNTPIIITNINTSTPAIITPPPPTTTTTTTPLTPTSTAITINTLPLLLLASSCDYYS